MSANETKECPFCAETIKVAAVLCRFCGRDLPPAGAVSAPSLRGSADLAGELSASPFPIRQPEVFDLLTALIERSLVVYEEDEQGRGRYRLLETVRQYSRDRLVEAGGSETARDRHLRFCLDLAEAAEPKLRGREQKAWSARLESEHDNLRAALEWAIDRDSEAALRLSGALGWFWYVRGPASEGHQWLERALARDGGAPTPWRAKALCGAGYLAGEQGDLARGRSHLEASVALWQKIGDLPGQAFALGLLATVGLTRDAVLAASSSEEGVALARLSRNGWALGFALLCRGEVARLQREDRLAGERYTECIALAREAGDEWLLCMALHGLAHSLQRRGERVQAAAHFRESLTLAYDQGIRVGVAYGLAGLGGVAAGGGDPVRAARLLAAAAELFLTLSQKMQPVDQVEFDRSVAAARALMAEAAFAAAWADGQKMSLLQAIEYALQQVESSS